VFLAITPAGARFSFPFTISTLQAPFKAVLVIAEERASKSKSFAVSA
jgi:hypothetical protein